MEVLGQVDEPVNQLAAKQYVQLSLHFGGKYYLWGTTGIACSDIREYYFNRSVQDVEPCKKGIALRIPEWVALKDVEQQLNKKHAVLVNAQSCGDQFDHKNLEGALNCMESHPFQYEKLFYSLSAKLYSSLMAAVRIGSWTVNKRIRMTDRDEMFSLINKMYTT